MKRLCFLVGLLWFSSIAAGQVFPSIEKRLSLALLQKLERLSATDSVTVAIAVNASAGFQPNRFRLQSAHPEKKFYTARIRKSELLSLAAQDGVVFINEQHFPKEELNTGAVDYSLNKLNLAHRLYPFVQGDSIAITIKERNFDTTDIDLKGRVFSTGLQASTQTAHAAQMATIVAGAGASSPFALGGAPAASVGSVDFANLFPEGDAVYAAKKISVQNHSYGTVVENFYGAEAAAYDASTVSNPALLHVFSAGNSGTSVPASGTYNGLGAVANLTGNFKQSKNTLSVAALDSTGSPMTAASRGPAYDGRLKPELSAYGEDGSSGAAALVSGAAALVQDVFKKRNLSLPSSDLVKAVLINSADDAGAAGIDYITGYGSLNAQKAVETVLQSRLLQGSVSPGATQSIALQVPANIAKLKVTLAWKDAPATAGAAKALVNDLDLSLRLPSAGQSWLPWVLNPSPGLAALQALPLRKVDTLNTVEQITVDNPSAGSYSIDVKGTKISAAQTFSVAYQFDTSASFAWTFPTTNDPLIGGKTQWLRWQTTYSGVATIEYATGANNWRTIANLSDVSLPYFKWTVPDTTTTAVLRMRPANGISIASDTFVISPQLVLQTGFNCNDSFLLYWNAVLSANYRLYQLSGNVFSAFAQQADTSLLLRKVQSPSVYYGVAPLVNGKQGLRSQTLNYVSSGVGCYVKSFYLQTQTASEALLFAEIGSLLNVQEVALEKQTANGFVALKTVASPNALQFLFRDSLLTQGENRYRFVVKLKSGATIYSNVETIYALASLPVVLYPNPAPQSASIFVLAKEAGRYSLQIWDAAGKLVMTQPLNSSRSQFLAARLPKGLYFIRVLDAQGKPFAHKLIVY